ncbi:heat shock protein DnaJ domain protein [Thioalkalivibrio nitratireducens DSM 14787]|uniref:Heat shock protein DnaJ domain protein n=1 Tax=Thioalkalivibrio nitratireducens (strain DSM 14787 / UNIQEM 213 / ALEN2) TaxID=1255043 RepID=L0DV38_THIND|nr:TIGR02281 family clan AA aspartic protease [Thioalkalivibrio nitratireducens]AGA32878.1 heat shock protein DnaJ domain protein [Thioalkalivibrio nitratireducens DSM 14787]
MRRIRTHYDNLQVQENASPEVIHAAWSSLMRKWHPDNHPDQPQQAEHVRQLIDEAYQVLSDPRRRRDHDAWIRTQRTRFEGVEPTPVGVQAGVYARAGSARRSGPLRLTVITLGWIVVFALLWWVFDDYLERREFPNRNLAIAEGASTELVLRRNHVGQYLAPGTINGGAVTFLLDTGATQVSVPEHLADDLGLRPGSRGRALTANGPVDIRHTRIRELGLGPFVLRNVSGHINPGMSSDQVLLGMSVLKYLDFAQQEGHLILTLP